MNFDIKFKNNEPNREIALGSIAIGNETDFFESSLSYWSKEQYEKQWIDGCQRICRGENISALITSMYDPIKANFIIWRPLYVKHEIVIAHEQILFIDELGKTFSEESLYEHVIQRKNSDEDGNAISEWKTNVHEIQKWLNANPG